MKSISDHSIFKISSETVPNRLQRCRWEQFQNYPPALLQHLAKGMPAMWAPNGYFLLPNKAAQAAQ